MNVSSAFCKHCGERFVAAEVKVVSEPPWGLKAVCLGCSRKNKLICLGNTPHPFHADFTDENGLPWTATMNFVV